MEGLLTFFLLSLFVVMSPGIDTALITKTTIATGKKTGFLMALGISTGSLVHTFAAAFGLSAILMQSAWAFGLVKYAGAMYLIYLGITSFRNKKSSEPKLPESKMNSQAPFKQGLLSNVLNPKVAMFFLTFLPQFVQPGENTTQQLVLIGIIYTVLSITWFFVYVFFINFLRVWLLSPKVQRLMDQATGLVLIGFGLKLAFDKH